MECLERLEASVGKREKIKNYWESRAAEFQENPAATTDDIHLRELEVGTLISSIRQCGVPSGAQILDVGCGDGDTTIKVAQEISEAMFLGVDYCRNMVGIAKKRLRKFPELESRVNFEVVDVLELDRFFRNRDFPFVLSDRCLINLESNQHQAEAIRQIARITVPGGYYIAIENFLEGHENMNQARKLVGLPEIPVRWHNVYFSEREFLEMIHPYFENVELKDFTSSYYFATRVIYSAACQMRGEEPDYDHEIHRLAPKLPAIGNFSPIRLSVLRRK